MNTLLSHSERACLDTQVEDTVVRPVVGLLLDEGVAALLHRVWLRAHALPGQCLSSMPVHMTASRVAVYFFVKDWAENPHDSQRP